MFKTIENTIYGTVVIPYAGRKSVVNFDITPEPKERRKSRRSLKKERKEKTKRVPIYTLSWE